jgi:hypothetical protein
MPARRSRILAALMGAALLILPAFALAQGGDQKPPEPPKPQAGQPAEPGKEEKKKIDLFAEAARLVRGPAGSAECVWSGTRVIKRLVQEDLDAALRHLELYDRFGCPGEHVQGAFRCFVKQGDLDRKAVESINNRVDACWLEPGAASTAAAAAPGPSNQ